MNSNGTIVSLRLYNLSKLREAVRKMKKFSWPVRINYLEHPSGIYVWDTEEETLKRVVDSSAKFVELYNYQKAVAIMKEARQVFGYALP